MLPWEKGWDGTGALKRRAGCGTGGQRKPKPRARVGQAKGDSGPKPLAHDLFEKNHIKREMGHGPETIPR